MKTLPYRRIILTGRPRVGKTTIVQKVIDAAADRNMTISGIMTPEITEKGRRTGFRIVDIRSGKNGILASVQTSSHQDKWRVGKYRVHRESLRDIGIPAIQEAVDNPETDLVIIDEIGKMEVLDTDFATIATKAMTTDLHAYSAIATVGRGIPRETRRRLDQSPVEEIQLDVSNRDQVARNLQQWIEKIALA